MNQRLFKNLKKDGKSGEFGKTKRALEQIILRRGSFVFLQPIRQTLKVGF
jgi:hypothetical protein